MILEPGTYWYLNLCRIVELWHLRRLVLTQHDTPSLLFMIFPWNNVTIRGITLVIQVNGVKNYTTNKIDGVKNYSMEKVNDALKTSYGQAVLGQVDSLLNSTEKCIDYYLPEDDGKQATTKCSQSRSWKNCFLVRMWKVHISGTKTAKL